MTSVLEIPTPSAPADTGTLVRALCELAELEFRLGEWTRAYASMAASLRTARACGLRHESARALTGLAQIEAARGRSADCVSHAGEAIRLSPGSCALEALASHAIGFLELGLGRTAAAIEWLDPYSLDLAEARVLQGDTAAARDALEGAERRQRRGSWAVAPALARVRAMLASDEACDALFHGALAWAARGQHPFEQARTELRFGERLRSGRRPREARPHLRGALAIFAALEARPWADRARRGLAAT
jgi:tetratricopeptide (TPR) repeat protein